MLTLEAVKVGYGAFCLAADLSLAPGRLVSVIGPSGAGKSTLLDVIAGFTPPTEGRVLWNSADLTELPARARPVSMLFQDQNLFPHFSIARNLALALRPDAGRLSPGQADQVGAALERVGLSEMSERKPGALSGGQQARAALARVLLQARPIILLDEPFAALGPALRGEMLEHVRAVAQEVGALTVMVSHDPSDAKRFAEEVIFVDAGRAEAPMPAQALFDSPTEALSAYLGQGRS